MERTREQLSAHYGVLRQLRREAAARRDADDVRDITRLMNPIIDELAAIAIMSGRPLGRRLIEAGN